MAMNRSSFGLSLADDVEQVGVLGRRQPLAVEVLQPPQVQPLGGQRVHAADDPLLGQARPPTGRKVTVSTSPSGVQTVTVTRRTDRSGVEAGQHPAQLGGQRVGVGGPVRPGQVEVDDQVAGSADSADRRRERGERGGQVGALGHQRDAGAAACRAARSRR